jgi:hypothetical protein
MFTCNQNRDRPVAPQFLLPARFANLAIAISDGARRAV